MVVLDLSERCEFSGENVVVEGGLRHLIIGRLAVLEGNKIDFAVYTDLTDVHL